MSNKKSPIHYARRIGVKIGENCRILSLKPNTFGSEPYLIQIGDHVTITSGVRFVTHDGGVWVFRGENPEIDVFGKIIIGNNVFIGINSIIMPGVEVGNNVVIGAGSVVTKSIPSNTVIGGVPARFICTLDDYEHKVMKKASFIKSKSKDTKKKILLEKLF
ncbi:acyltransferase [Peribacillus sp. TH27]|nr:acyltransferase [Peribacillus sp. TH27]